MAPLTQIIGAGMHPDDWSRNYLYLIQRMEVLTVRLEALAARLDRLEMARPTVEVPVKL